MIKTINLTEARKNLPELTDRAHAGHTFIMARRGRQLAVLIGVDEYKRLKEVEHQQRQQDFDVLLAPPGPMLLSEEEAQTLAVKTVREVRTDKRNNET